MTFAVAKFWGLQPHVVWHYPFRYYRELRDFYIATTFPVTTTTVKDDDESIVEVEVD